MTLLAYIIGVVIFGWGIVIKVAPRLHRGEQIALGYLVGWSVVTLVLFGFNYVHISIDRGSSVLLLVVLSALGVVMVRGKERHNSVTQKPWTATEKWLAGLLSLIIATVTIYGMWGVVSTWDALTLYDFRALRIVETGSITQAATLQGSYFYSYPLFTSLAHVWLYLGHWTSPLFFYAGVYIALLTIFYFRLRTVTPRLYSLVGTLMVAIAPHYFWHSQIAYTNLPYSVYLGLGAIFILSYIRTNRVSYLVLGSLLTGLSTWVRSVEPFWLVNVGVAILAVVVKKKPLHGAIPLALVLPLERLWKVYSAAAQSQVAQSSLGQIASVTQVVTGSVGNVRMTNLVISSAHYFVTNAIRPYLPVVVLLAVVMLIKIVLKSKSWWDELLVGGYYGVAFVGTYVFASTQDYWSNIPGSLERMMMFVSIPIIYMFIRAIYYLYE